MNLRDQLALEFIKQIATPSDNIYRVLDSVEQLEEFEKDFEETVRGAYTMADIVMTVRGEVL